MKSGGRRGTTSEESPRIHLENHLLSQLDLLGNRGPGRGRDEPDITHRVLGKLPDAKASFRGKVLLALPLQQTLNPCMSQNPLPLSALHHHR